MLSLLLLVHCEPRSLLNFQKRVLLSKLILAPGNDCTLNFPLLLINKLLHFANEVRKLVSFVVDRMFMNSIDAFAGFGGEDVWRGSQTAFLPDRVQHSVPNHSSCPRRKILNESLDQLHWVS